MPTTQNRLPELIEKRNILLNKLNLFKDDYKSGNLGPKRLSRLSSTILEIKALNHRIAKLGTRHNIVYIKGKYAIKTGKLVAYKNFEIYFTDISIFDATSKVEMQYPDGTANLKADYIPTGKALEFSFKSGF